MIWGRSRFSARGLRAAEAHLGPRVNRAYFTRSGFIASPDRHLLSHRAMPARFRAWLIRPAGHAYGRELGHTGELGAGTGIAGRGSIQHVRDWLLITASSATRRQCRRCRSQTRACSLQPSFPTRPRTRGGTAPPRNASRFRGRPREQSGWRSASNASTASMIDSGVCRSNSKSGRHCRCPPRTHNIARTATAERDQWRTAGLSFGQDDAEILAAGKNESLCLRDRVQECRTGQVAGEADVRSGHGLELALLLASPRTRRRRFGMALNARTMRSMRL